jgi:putative DNA primase/helicase
VDGAALFDEIASTIRAHVVLSPAQADAAALWCGHAHALELSWFNPRLAARSPVKRCGKTTLLEVIASITPRSLPASNISAAAVFRTIEACQPTLIIDEADTFLGAEHATELRGILNAGHTRTAAFVIRVVPTSAGELEPRKFSVWSPIAVGMIGKLPGTLADRSIEITLQRKRAGDKVAKFRLDRVEHLHTLGRKLARFARDNAAKIQAADPETPAALHDRAADNWRPLLAIAEAAGGNWPARSRKAAMEVHGAADDADERGVQLLADIKAVFEAGDDDALWTEELLELLTAMKERPWVRGEPRQAAHRSRARGATQAVRNRRRSGLEKGRQQARLCRFTVPGSLLPLSSARP